MWAEFALVLLLVVLIIYCGGAQQDTFTAGPRTVILYYADWCGACKMFKPTWAKIKALEGPNLRFKEVNVSEATDDIAQTINAIPAIVVVDAVSGKTYKYDGSRDYASVKRMIMAPTLPW
jgi:thiol-disulfide isomerase/thioredoxin